MAVKLDIINKSGAWFSYKDARLGQGRDNVKEYIRTNPEFAAEIEQQVRENKDRLMAMGGSKTLKKGLKPMPKSVQLDVEVDDEEEPAQAAMPSKASE